LGAITYLVRASLIRGIACPEIRFCVVFTVLTLAIFAALYLAPRSGCGNAQSAHCLAGERGHAWARSRRGRHRRRGQSARLRGGDQEQLQRHLRARRLYAAAVWAYPASLGAKVARTLIGADVLNLVNLLRVVTLLALGIFARDWFDVAHLYVWQAAFFAVVALCWFGRVLRVSPRT
jgi:exosortase/archaeosortase family protein